jgi:hypothetical protein
MPWLAVNAPGDAIQRAAGNSAAGVKWRFLGREGTTIAWAVYPQFEFNTGRAAVDKGIVDEGHAFLLPTEITLEIAHAEFNVEVGRNFVSRGDNSWVYGFSTEGHVLPRLEMLAELHGEREGPAPTELIVNIGGRFVVAGGSRLMFAVGRAVRGEPDERRNLILWSGLQLNLPGLYEVDRKAGVIRGRRTAASSIAAPR